MYAWGERLNIVNKNTIQNENNKNFFLDTVTTRLLLKGLKLVKIAISLDIMLSLYLCIICRVLGCNAWNTLRQKMVS